MMKIVFIILFLLFWSPAFAGYADVIPPSELRPSPGGGFVYKPSFPANDHSYDGWRHFKGTLPINGTTKVPMAAKYSANASRLIFQHAVRNPFLFTPTGALVAALPFVLEMMGQDFRFFEDEFQENRKHTRIIGRCVAASAGWCDSFGPLPDGYEICGEKVSYPASNDVCYPVGPLERTEVVETRWEPASPDIVPEMPRPMPKELPDLWPDPLPVDRPVINPNVNPEELPDNSPFPGEARPFLVPTGDPEPIPNPNPITETNPQRYRQPWTEVVPSPTPDRPLRVDTRPIVTETQDPRPITDPIVQTTSPQAPDDETKAPDETADLCANNPEILACQKLGTPENSDIPRSQQPITLQQGPSFGGGSCPPNLQVSIFGQSIQVADMSAACGWISTFLRPMILLMAALSALMIVYPKGD